MLLSLGAGVQSRAAGRRPVSASLVSRRVAARSQSQRPMGGSYVGNGSTLRRCVLVSVGKDGTPICLVFFCHRHVNHSLAEDDRVVLQKSTSFPSLSTA